MRRPDYTIDDENQTIIILQRKSPLIHHHKWVEKLQKDYPGYTVVHDYK